MCRLMGVVPRPLTTTATTRPFRNQPFGSGWRGEFTIFFRFGRASLTGDPLKVLDVAGCCTRVGVHALHFYQYPGPGSRQKCGVLTTCTDKHAGLLSTGGHSPAPLGTFPPTHIPMHHSHFPVRSPVTGPLPLCAHIHCQDVGACHEENWRRRMQSPLSQWNE